MLNLVAADTLTLLFLRPRFHRKNNICRTLVYDDRCMLGLNLGRWRVRAWIRDIPTQLT